MGIAIGTHDAASGRIRYLRDDSTEDIQWSTVDSMRAKVWHTAEGAQAWVYALPDRSYKRMFSQSRFFVHVAREAVGGDLLREFDDALFNSVSFAEVDDCLDSARRERERRGQAKGKR